MAQQLPHDLLTEKSLLGCLLIDGSSYDEINDLGLKQDDFYHPQYGAIFNVIKDLHVQSEPIDLVTVCAKLNDQGKLDMIGGQSAVLNLIEDQASSANVYHYAKSLKDKAVIREIIRTATRVIESGSNFNGDVEDFVGEVESSFFKLTNQTKNEGLKDFKHILKLNLKELEDTSRNRGEISGLSTGFKDIDRRLLGLQPGQFVILAARPAMGKTALALNFAINAAKGAGLPVAIFSLEMLAPELSMRILASEAAVDAMRLRTKNYLDSDLRNIANAVQGLSKLPLFINDAADINLVDIRSQCRKIKMEQGLGLVVVDYLQLMQSHTGNPSREQQISEISRGLKNLAKELECPVLALSQLNRAVESRTDKRPMVSDLRESGSIEQDADIVMLIYRDEVYNKETKDKGIAEVIVGKNRAGETGTAKLAWIGSQTKFANLSFEPNE
jgi:replicative DNA helicase